MKRFVTRPTAASVTLPVAASLAVGGCGSTGNSSTAGCLSKSLQPAASGAAAGWTLPAAICSTRGMSPALMRYLRRVGTFWPPPTASAGIPGTGPP